MSAQKVRIGVLGAGFIGNVHMKSFGGHTSSIVTGLYDAQADIAQGVASELGIETTFPSAEALITSPDIDAVVVAVPNKFHADLAQAALAEGKHVLLEKPMALNAIQAASIVKAAKASGTVLMIAHQMRWIWLSRQVKERAVSGAFGNIYNAKTGMWRTRSIPGWGSWFTRKNESGGGPLIDIGVHALDLALYLMGNPKPMTVFGSTYAAFGPKKLGLGNWGTPQMDGVFDVEDLATAMIKMDNGSTLTLEVSWAANTDSQTGFFVHLMGSDGGASLYSDHAMFFDSKEQDGERLEAPEDVEDPRELITDHFLECIAEGKQPISDGISGLVNNIVLDSIYTSAESGKAVDIDWSILE